MVMRFLPMFLNNVIGILAGNTDISILWERKKKLTLLLLFFSVFSFEDVIWLEGKGASAFPAVWISNLWWEWPSLQRCDWEIISSVGRHGYEPSSWTGLCGLAQGPWTWRWKIASPLYLLIFEMISSDFNLCVCVVR